MEAGDATKQERPSWHGYVPALQGRWLEESPEEGFRITEASLLFADVSGFTALAERLARRGKVGAEELNEKINHVFTRLIAAVEEVGGDVIKFGGDALLVYFDGEGHAERAAAGGIAMQGGMARVRRDRGAGTGNLEVSIGVASGECHLFLAGDPYRDLLLAGPLASGVVAAEGIAEAGEVRVWEQEAADRAAGPEEQAPLITAAPAAAGIGPPPRAAELGLDASLPPHLHGFDPEPEHRSLGIAFIQASGLGAVLDETGPAGLSAALEALVRATQASAERHGVTYLHSDVDRDAIKLILVAGAPSSAPDDDDRLVHATRNVVRQRSPFRVRAGVNRGRAFVANLGAPHRHVWTVLGDPVNLAARVMGKAEPRQVLATRSVLERLRDDFERTPVAPFMVKGKSEPVDAEIIGSARGASAAVVASSLEVFGRERELAEIRAVLASALAGDGGVVQLVGEPGIGKSTLVGALVADARGSAFTTTIQAGPYSAFTPYRAIHDPLRAILLGQVKGGDEEITAALTRRVGEIDPDLLPWLPLIGVPLGLELPETEQTREIDQRFVATRTADALSRLIEAVLPPGTSLLVIEDAHWIDTASAEVLSHLIRRLGERGNMALITRRPGSGGLDLADDERVRTIMLEPLDEEAARALIEAGESGLPSKLIAALVARAGGNPLYLHELLAAAHSGEDVESLPESIEGLITARIDTLAPRDRTLLRQASVLGNRAPVALLAELSGAERIDEALSRLDGFVAPLEAGMIGFRHALLRDAAYEALSFRRRRELHARAAELIAAQSGGAVELLAIHHHAAGQWAESWRASIEAGAAAERHGGAQEAARFYAIAVEAAKKLKTIDPEEVASIAERLGDAATLAADYAIAASGYGEARRRRRDDPLATALLCRKEGRLRETSDRYPAALGWFTRGLRALQGADGGDSEVESMRAKLLVARGGTNWLQGRLRDAVPTLQDGAETAIFAEDRATLAHAYYLLDTVLSALGDPEAHLYRDLALPIFEDLGDHDALARALNNRGLGAYVEGKWTEALELYDRCRVESDRIGDVDGVATAEYNIAEVLAAQGRLDEADDLLHEILAIWRAANFRVGLGVTWRLLGRIAAHRGEFERSREMLEKAREQLSEGGAKLHLLEVDVNEAERLLLAGQHQHALPILGETRASAHELGAPPWMLAWLQRLAGHAKLQAGERDAALIRFEEAIQLATGAGVEHEHAFSMEAIADAGASGGTALRASAERIYEQLGIVSRPQFPR